MQASILGFQPVQALGQCYFVPFGNTKSGNKDVQFIIGYKGYVDLARRSGEIKTIYAHAVYSNDDFKYELGLEPVLHHVPAEGDRGELTHSYAVAHFTNGGYAFEVVDKYQVLKRRKASQSSKSDYSPWVKWEEEMWIKTAIRILSKWLPLSVDIAANISSDEKTIAPENFGQDGELNLDDLEATDFDIINDPPEDTDSKNEKVTDDQKKEPNGDQNGSEKVTRTTHKQAFTQLLDKAMEYWEMEDQEAAEKAVRNHAHTAFNKLPSEMNVRELKKMISGFDDGDYPTPF
jgi:recombination protein RecT